MDSDNAPNASNDPSRHPSAMEITPQAGVPGTDPDVDYAKAIWAEGTDLLEVKGALDKMINKAVELSRLLAQAQQSQSELETSLVLTKSNLTLAIANNEMLEDALKREGSKDLGWRRWSEKEGLLKKSLLASGAVHNASDDKSGLAKHERGGSGGTESHVDDQEGPNEGRERSLSQSSTTLSPVIIHSPTPTGSATSEKRFFKFFGPSSTKEQLRPSTAPARTSSAASSRSPSVTPVSSPSVPHAPILGHRGVTNSHIVSASLPSLNTPVYSSDSADDDVRLLLEKERAALETLRSSHAALQASHCELQASHSSAILSKSELEASKKALEEELESLSQALFEEANKMVAEERRKRAAFEEELGAVKAEKDALKGTLRIIEGENGLLRQQAQGLGGSDSGEDSLESDNIPHSSEGDDFWHPTSADRSSMIALRSDSPPRQSLDLGTDLDDAHDNAPTPSQSRSLVLPSEGSPEELLPTPVPLNVAVTQAPSKEQLGEL